MYIRIYYFINIIEYKSNNTKGIFDVHNHNDPDDINNSNNSLIVKINNCTFIENGGLFIIDNSHIILENSKFI